MSNYPCENNKDSNYSMLNQMYSNYSIPLIGFIIVNYTNKKEKYLIIGIMTHIESKIRGKSK